MPTIPGLVPSLKPTVEPPAVVAVTEAAKTVRGVSMIPVAVGDQRKSRFGISESCGVGWGFLRCGEASGASFRWGRLRRW
jgi:hypothetical protein